MKIPLPSIPGRVTDALDIYSYWAAEPTGPSFTLSRWHYTVLRRDWVSIAQMLAIASVYMWWTDGGELAFGLGVAAGALAWVWFEASLWSPKGKL